MLQSNQPYQRVDDSTGSGFTNGFLIGGAAGAGLTGYTHYSTGKMSRLHLDNLRQFKKDRRTKAAIHTPEEYKATYDELKGVDAYKEDTKIHNAYKGAFGTGKRRALSYGASVLAPGLLGGGIGAAIDTVNN